MIVEEGVHPINTHLLVPEFEYAAPATLRDALALLAQRGAAARVLAGGTYLLVQMKMEQLAPHCLIDIRGIPDLHGIAFDEGETAVRIGANTPIRALRDAPWANAGYTALAEACAAFGSVQIEYMGTLGGNICSGSPASDTLPALLAFDAQLALAGADWERALPLADFLLGPGRTALRQHELLVSVALPKPPPGAGSAFIKISRVAADLAKASVASMIVRDGDRIVDCRIALGSVAPTAMRAKRAEACLVGKTFGSEYALEAGRIASEEISPIDDVRSTAWYRREVVKALVHDALRLAWQRAGRRGEKEKGRGGEEERGDHVSRFTHHASRITHHVSADEHRDVTLTINGEKRRLWVKPNDLLINVLREKLELTGAKYGCGVGECGACTIHLNGKPALACLVLAVAADGSEVSTVEGLQGPNGELDPLQQAFIDHAAFQCGYCTPGMLMMTKSLLKEKLHPSQDDIRDYLKVNRCRCTGFASILRAVMSMTQPNGNAKI